MTNKEATMAFLKMAGSGHVRAAYEQFIAPNFIHHNQYFKGDRQSLMDAKQSPNKSIEIKHVYEDGDTVITHSLVIRQDPQAPPIAVVHIFRFEKDQVVELWDLGQPIAKDSPNQYGMF